MYLPHNYENNMILTSSALSVPSKYRPLLLRIPLLLPFCLKPALNWHPLESSNVCWSSRLSWVEAVTWVTSKLLQQFHFLRAGPWRNKSTKDVSKNGPPLPITMTGIEEREWAGQEVGGEAAILQQPCGHSRWLCDIWTAVRRDNHCLRLLPG